VIIATVGTLSGPVGATLVKVAEGVQVWVKAVNERGGVNGHPVKHLMYDDGLDPARHRAQVQEAIEAKGVIAFVGNPEGITGQPSQQYVTSKRVPVVGSETAGQFFYNSPMYFPQASHGLETFGAAIQAAAQPTVPAGKVRLGTLTCVEAQACEDADRVWAAEAPGLGFQHVYRSRVSIGQPDFTAECLAAQNAKVEVFIAGTDTASISRLAASCARQGFKPTFTTLSGLIADRMKTDANLDGMIGSSNVFPYFQSGTPPTDEYQRAMRTYGTRVEPGVGAATGWVAAKLFERAAAQLPEPPTSEAVLAGLWTVRNDTLGGLTQPLTFLENQPAKPLRCWFNIVISNGAWKALDGFQQHCSPKGEG
jgi:branched-chain amino acid transport system substrate-binding protein